MLAPYRASSEPRGLLHGPSVGDFTLELPAVCDNQADSENRATRGRESAMNEVRERPANTAPRTVVGAGLTVIGLGLVAVSRYMLFDNVQVSGGLLNRLGLGLRGFGWSVLPLLFGIGWLIWRPRHACAWALIAIGVGILVFEILGSLTFYFRPVSLITLLIMLVPGAVGLALVAKHV
jgi:hypothetical protein